MATRGFLIRFIDIGLIVLFGFLMISDIEASTRVELADASAEAEPLEERPDEETSAYVAVEIEPDGSFWITDTEAPMDDAGREASDDTDDAEEVEGDGAAEPAADVASSVRAPDVATLERVLREIRTGHAARGRSTVVLIQPDPDSVVQATVDVMDVCDRLSLAKSLRMDIEIAAPGGRP